MKGSRLPSNTGDPFEKLLFFILVSGVQHSDSVFLQVPLH